jgi:hypothetical protein
MAFGELQRPRYPVQVITTQYVFTGEVEPFGPLVLWLNDTSREAISLYGVQGAALDAGRAVETLARDELLLLKHDIVAIDLPSPEARQTVSLMPRSEKVVIYTARFVFSGAYSLSAETRLPEMLDTLKGDFFPLLSAQLHPLSPPRVPVFRASEMVILNRRQLSAYHAL